MSFVAWKMDTKEMEARPQAMWRIAQRLEADTGPPERCRLSQVAW